MKKTFFTRLFGVVASAVIINLLPLGVSAEWKLNSDRTWSYLEEESITRGWKNISNEWYYFNSNGTMQVGWICDKGTWYYLNSSGEMLKEWVNVTGVWYYFDSTGAMKTGWLKDNGNWYYLDYQKGMQKGTANLNGISYYFDESGKLQGVINSNQTTENNKTTSGQAAVVATTKSNTYKETTQNNNSNTKVYVSGLPKLPDNFPISILDSSENKILELMNQKRTEAGLSPLVMDNTLLQVARYKSNHMIQYNYFDHTTPQGNNWSSWLKAIGYRFTSTGENIAYNNYNPVQLFDQWWNSPGHKANMMNPSYNRVGIGILKGNGKYMGTQTFSN